ncbi:MAG: phosphotransferase [Lachnospiraceae bacterium]|nr:phosphotransferase [Lachnospiraceae bacterium]
MTKNEFTLLYAIKKHGILSVRSLKEKTGLSTGYISQSLRTFTENGWINDKAAAKKGLCREPGITEKGLEALRPYKVDNAVIMAAGMSTRFVPLSLEKPKGLLVVKNEVLIERQIEQLLEAGIREIVLILGYKKEAFFYLESKYPGLKIVINPEYNTKNNTHTLYVAKKYIKNSYICSSDDYFEENPFEDYVYQSYYAAEHVTEKTNEWYMNPDAKGNIGRVEKSGTEGDIMLGHVYWTREFSKIMMQILTDDAEVGNYDAVLWEQVLAENLKILPPMEIKVYPKGVIFEFDSLDELREFDANYVNHTHSRIMKNIAKVLSCKESDILNFKPIKEGLTNTSFVFEVEGSKYVYRHPGDGTEAIISRAHEKKALELAKSIGVDPTFICMDEEEGWKISHFVEGIRIPSYDSFEDSKRLLAVLRNLHKQKLSVDWAFLPWEDAAKIEEILRAEKGGIADQEFDALKDAVKKCFDKCQGDGVEMRFCHCDTYAPNWMLAGDGRTILIDWEYAGNADPGCDLGCYIMDSMWEVEEAERFVAEYCGEEYNDILRFHYLAYTAIVSYYWYVWALYREACGAVMGESLYNWHVMAKRYSRYLVEEFGL